MTNADFKWYPVSTNPRAEKKAYAHLQNKGIETYLPLRKSLKQWSDRKKWVEEPLIPSYLFVRSMHHKLSDVLSTPGICRFIYFSGKVCAIPEAQIKSLQLLLANETDFELSPREFKKGEEVEVIAGALAGMRGELVEAYSGKRFIIRLEHTGHSLLVQVPAAFLESVAGLVKH